MFGLQNEWSIWEPEASSVSAGNIVLQAVPGSLGADFTFHPMMFFSIVKDTITPPVKVVSLHEVVKVQDNHPSMCPVFRS